MEEGNKNKPLTLRDDIKAILNDVKILAVILFIAWILLAPFTITRSHYHYHHLYGGYLLVDDYQAYSHFPIYTGKRLDSIPKPEYFKLPLNHYEISFDFPYSPWSSTAIQKQLPEPIKKYYEKQQAWNNHRDRVRQILGY